VVLQQGEQMGYASPKTVRMLIQRHRDTGLPPTLTADSILRVGVSESLAPRTVQTLKLLGMIDEEGQHTEQFRRLRQLSTAEFKPELISLLKSAYATVFEVLEPAGASYETVQDAFRTFKPEGQRDRMVALFLGLLEYAEYSDDLPSGRSASVNRNTTAGAPRKPRPVKDNSSSQANTARRAPVEPSQSQEEATPLPVHKGEKVEVKLGSYGTVVAYVDVQWLSVPPELVPALRQAIDGLKALAYEDSAPLPAGAVDSKFSEERAS